LPPPFYFYFLAQELAKPRPAFAYAFALLLARLVVVRKVAFAPARNATARPAFAANPRARNAFVNPVSRRRLAPPQALVVVVVAEAPTVPAAVVKRGKLAK